MSPIPLQVFPASGWRLFIYRLIVEGEGIRICFQRVNRDTEWGEKKRI